ncbi:coat protein [ssRNA phage Gerhypos.1_51]|uniref:Coat protein n=2 Tax=Norzivirales TaxID=2842247 RepID=A0A8S5L1W0_9VIRU|nr:coat protein [ssRNA phage Gerhypos.1_51]QDH90197.1 MAG: hypothetical protein H1Bulk30972_000002 [Leviviridae sp.]DAD51349.1 TPA_asm: coat protein [ssRNA phage Gerhypos.1_51]
MALTVNAGSYTADSFNKDSVSYIGPAKTVTIKDDVKLSRTAPKPSASFSGLGRTEAKLTRTLTLTGALTSLGDAIVSVQVSVPVGYTAANVDTLLDDFGAFVASASMKSHVKSQKISY